MTRKEAIEIIKDNIKMLEALTKSPEISPDIKNRVFRKEQALKIALASLDIDENYELDYEDAKAAAGYWIIETECEGKTRTCICGNCKYSTGKTTWKNPNFCENCGADMREFNKIYKESGWD